MFGKGLLTENKVLSITIEAFLIFFGETEKGFVCTTNQTLTHSSKRRGHTTCNCVTLAALTIFV